MLIAVETLVQSPPRPADNIEVPMMRKLLIAVVISFAVIGPRLRET